MNEKMLSLLSKVANRPTVANALVISGIISTCIGNVLIMYGSYYRGVKNGVEARDDYYLQKEIKEYEKRQK